MNEANKMDKKLQHSNGETDVNKVDGLPPVRSQKTIIDDKNETAKSNVSNSKKRVKPRDYKEWDKFDVEKELENADKKEEQCKPESDERESKVKIEPISTKELKIGKYLEAIDDCFKVLEKEPKNIKAFLRRGMAYKALKNQELAVKDFNSMLEIDPKNKRAKDLLAEIEISNRESEKTKPEAEGVEANNHVIHETESKDNAGAKTRRKGQRLKIVEIESGDDLTGDNHAEQQNSENGKLQDNNLSKGILEDLKVVNSVKGEQEEISVDNMVNGETSDSVNKKNTLTMAEEPGAAVGSEESGTENEVACSSATKSGDKNEPSGLPTSENGDSSGVAEKEGLQKTEELQNKEEVVLEIPEEVKNLMKEGNELYEMGHHSEALVKYTKCVELLWEDRESYASAVSGLFNNKAACYFKMGEYKQCVLQCDESLNLVDSNLKALLRRGTAYEAMEKYAEAFRDFNRVRLIDGSNKIAQEHCSRVLYMLASFLAKWESNKSLPVCLLCQRAQAPEKGFPLGHLIPHSILRQSKLSMFADVCNGKESGIARMGYRAFCSVCEDVFCKYGERHLNPKFFKKFHDQQDNELTVDFGENGNWLYFAIISIVWRCLCFMPYCKSFSEILEDLRKFLDINSDYHDDIDSRVRIYLFAPNNELESKLKAGNEAYTNFFQEMYTVGFCDVDSDNGSHMYVWVFMGPIHILMTYSSTDGIPWPPMITKEDLDNAECCRLKYTDKTFCVKKKQERFFPLSMYEPIITFGRNAISQTIRIKKKEEKSFVIGATQVMLLPKYVKYENGNFSIPEHFTAKFFCFLQLSNTSILGACSRRKNERVIFIALENVVIDRENDETKNGPLAMALKVNDGGKVSYLDGVHVPSKDECDGYDFSEIPFKDFIEKTIEELIKSGKAKW